MWTEQTIETLKKFALEGRSAAWIAAALGAPSRNAVIGKANRIGVKLNGMRAAPFGDEAGLDVPPPLPWGRKRPPNAEGPRRYERRPTGETPWSKALSAARSSVPAIAREKRRADRRVYGAAEVGEMRRIGFADIADVECRWPLGDPTQDDFAYCGLQIAKGHAYCPGHCRVVYRPPNA
jgi:GcrA cell cycle regulator